MSEQFKTCMFGGFAKNDVVTFIAKQAEEHQSKITELQTSLEEAQQRNQQLEEALRTLHSKAAVFQESSQYAAELSDRVEQMQAQLEALQQENEKLKGPAQSYFEVKDHIAEIEISAHRRTEEFRAQAITKLRALIEQQKSWCNEQRGRYQGMNEDTLQTLRRCEQLVQKNDSEAFDRMIARLQELEDGLTNE